MRFACGMDANREGRRADWGRQGFGSSRPLSPVFVLWLHHYVVKETFQMGWRLLISWPLSRARVLDFPGGPHVIPWALKSRRGRGDSKYEKDSTCHHWLEHREATRGPQEGNKFCLQPKWAWTWFSLTRFQVGARANWHPDFGLVRLQAETLARPAGLLTFGTVRSRMSGVSSC